MNYLEGDWHRFVIEGLVRAKPNCVYIEIGVRGCETIAQVSPHCKAAHGVDIDPECITFMPPMSYFWHCTSGEFFQKYDGEPADVVFIDGDHSEGIVRADFMASLDLLANHGVVALHDTWPILTSGNGATHLHAGCGEAWIVASEIHDSKQFDSITIPRFPGLTLVTK